MNLKRLRLVNYAQHADRVFDFPESGLCIIQGPNGCGKSNVLKALQFAITGVTPLVKKSDALRWGTDSGNVELSFTVDGVPGELTRNLHNTKALLRFGDDVYTKIADVDNCLANLMKVSKGVTDSFVFIKQGDTTSILDARQSERNTMLNKLFGTDRFQAVYSAVGSELTFYSGKLAGAVTGVVTELEAEKSALEKHIQTLSANYSDAAHEALSKAIAVNLSKLLEFDRIQLELKHPVTGLDATIERASSLTKSSDELRIAKENSDQYHANCVAALAAVQPQKQSLLSAQSALAVEASMQQMYATALQKKQIAEKALASLHAELVKLCGSVITLGEATTTRLDCVKRKQALESQLALETAAIASFKDGKCPTCGTTEIVGHQHETRKLSDLIQAGQRLLDTLRAEIKEVEREDALYANIMGICTSCNTLQTEIDNAAPILQKAFVSKSQAELDAEKERIVTQLKQIDAAEAAERAARELKLKAESSLALAEKDIANALMRIKELMEKETTLSRQSLSEIESALVRDRAEFKRLDEAKLSLLVANRTLPDLTKRLAAAKAAERERAVTKRYCATLELAKEVFHWGKLPQELSSVYFSRINSLWNQLLAQLDVPFTVQILPDSNIQIRFADNQFALAEQLSGGQRCCLALAFLLAVGNMFGNSVGFLVLDEPTYGLDSDHIERVSELFTNLQNYAKSKSLQIVIVTHEERLKTTAPYLISI